MLSDRKLNQQQKIGFLREGHLVIQGDFSVGMIADLLELLETNEDDSRGEVRLERRLQTAITRRELPALLRSNLLFCPPTLT